MNPAIFFSLWFTIVFLCSYLIFNYPLTLNLFIVIISVLLSSIVGFFFSLKSKEKSIINLNVETKNIKRIFLITMFFWCYDQFHILSGMFQYFDITNPKNTKDLITQSFFENERLGFSEAGKGISTTINTLFGSTLTTLTTTLTVIGRDSGARITIPINIQKTNN